jgi:transposase
VDFVVTAGQVNDCTQAIPLLGERKTGHVLADKGYDSDAIVEHVATMGAVAVIPPKSNRKVQREYDKDLYKQRNRIERCFAKLKHFRRFATRYEKNKEKLPGPRRSRLLVATPSAICRHALAPLPPARTDQEKRHLSTARRTAPSSVAQWRDPRICLSHTATYSATMNSRDLHRQITNG